MIRIATDLISHCLELTMFYLFILINIDFIHSKQYIHSSYRQRKNHTMFIWHVFYESSFSFKVFFRK